MSKTNPPREEIESRLEKICREYSLIEQGKSSTFLIDMWPHDVDGLDNSNPIEAIELEFDFKLERAQAWELYEMSVVDAAEYLLQKFTLRSENDLPGPFKDITPDYAVEILKEMWALDHVSRNKISYAISSLELKERNRKK